eukprot:183354_1
MTLQNKDVQAHKNLLRELEKDGLSVIPSIDDNADYDDIDFKSCGDIKKDLQNITNKTIQSQTQLFELDQNYYPIHNEIKSLRTVKHELDEFIDNYKMQISQLNRVLQRIGKHIEENKSIKESTTEAVKATQSQQTLIINKISEKVSEVEGKITSLEEKQDVETSEEIQNHREFLRGLDEFLSGIEKMRKQSESKIQHLDNVVTQLIEQRASINREIRHLKGSAIMKIRSIREQHLKPVMVQLSDEYDTVHAHDQQAMIYHDMKPNTDDSEDLNAIELPNYRDIAPSTMVGLLHRREKYMNKVYKRIHDLESRALTTSSTDYLSSLTEIRELQLIFGDTKLRYFYNKYVRQCNEVFNDCCLAFQAILEYTAEIHSPIITQLKGIKLFTSVTSNKTVDGDDRTARDQLEVVVDFVGSLPDREIVIMQVARYLATSLPFRDVIRGIKDRKYINVNEEVEEEKEIDEKRKAAQHLIKIDEFVHNKIREWMGSILQIYGNSAFTSVKVALENDVVAQVRP